MSTNDTLEALRSAVSRREAVLAQIDAALAPALTDEKLRIIGEAWALAVLGGQDAITAARVAIEMDIQRRKLT